MVTVPILVEIKMNIIKHPYVLLIYTSGYYFRTDFNLNKIYSAIVYSIVIRLLLLALAVERW
jgi:hypothetical protein